MSNTIIYEACQCSIFLTLSISKCVCHAVSPYPYVSLCFIGDCIFPYFLNLGQSFQESLLSHRRTQYFFFEPKAQLMHWSIPCRIIKAIELRGDNLRISIFPMINIGNLFSVRLFIIKDARGSKVEKKKIKKESEDQWRSWISK